MSKYTKYVERIFDYFSEEISADLYWKLFIFAQFSDPRKKKKDYSDVKDSLDKEYRRIVRHKDSFFEKFKNFNLTTLKEEHDKFFKHTDKIDRVLQYSTIDKLYKIITVTEFNRWMQKLYPSPYAMGILQETWNIDSINMILEFFFTTDEINGICIPTNGVNSIKFLLSKKDAHYLYLFNYITKYQYCKSDKKYIRPSRQYNHTLFSAVYTDLCSCALASQYESTMLTKKPSSNILDGKIDISFFDRLLSKREFKKNVTYNTFSPLYIILIHKTPELEEIINSSSIGMLPFPLIAFNSYDDLLNQLSSCNELSINLTRLKELDEEVKQSKYQMKYFYELESVLDNLKDLYMFPEIAHTKK